MSAEISPHARPARNHSPLNAITPNTPAWLTICYRDPAQSPTSTRVGVMDALNHVLSGEKMRDVAEWEIEIDGGPAVSTCLQARAVLQEVGRSDARVTEARQRTGDRHIAAVDLRPTQLKKHPRGGHPVGVSSARSADSHGGIAGRTR